VELRGISGPLGVEALVAVANTRHGLDAKWPYVVDEHYYVNGGADHLRDGGETVRFLRALGHELPAGRPARGVLLNLRDARSALRALAEGDRAGYERRLRRLVSGRTLRLDHGALAPTDDGWDGYVVALALTLAHAATVEQRLRVCLNARCGWVFLDRSRNALQQYCAEQRCAGRERVRRFRRRAAAR
jgi:predicted RNA-binding Zn ribbon-like protein